jgi:hypothetical protein
MLIKGPIPLCVPGDVALRIALVGEVVHRAGYWTRKGLLTTRGLFFKLQGRMSI